MAAYTNIEVDIVLSDVHISLSHSENISQEHDHHTKQTWLSRFYFHLPQSDNTASQPLKTLATGFGHYDSSTPTSRTKMACYSIETSLPQLDEDGDYILLKRGSQKLFQEGLKSSFQHQKTSRISQKIDPGSLVLLPVCETTCLLEKDPRGFNISEGRITVEGKTENVSSNVSGNNGDINLPHGIAYNSENLLVVDNVHGALDKSLLEMDEDEDVILERRRANLFFQNTLKVDGDEKDIFPLPQKSYPSMHLLSADRKFTYSTPMNDNLLDCGVVSVPENQNDLLENHTTCDSYNRKETFIDCCEKVWHQTSTSNEKVFSSSFNEFDACKEENKFCSWEVKSEKAAHNLSPHRQQLAQDHRVLLNKGKLKFVQMEPSNNKHLHSDDNFSVNELKTLDKISNEEHCQKEGQVMYGVLTLEHSMGTSIPEVGYQVWSGALLLCDYLIHNCTDLHKAVVLDLGTGTGITAIVAAMFAPRVLSTDYLPGIVGLAERNWDRNKDLLCLRACDQICFKVLDWTRDWRSVDSDPESKYTLTSFDLKLIDEATLILAAEAIYDDELTDGLFTTIYNLLMKPPSKIVVLTVERRVIFSVENKDVCSPAYEHFLANLEDLVTVDEGPVHFTAKKLNANLPQFFHYQRVKELELWEISSHVSR